eukprot:gene20351-22355_t
MADKMRHAEGDVALKFDQLSEDLRKATLHKLELFESIRGRECNIPFWDIVVITAIDVAQKEAYEQQIAEKVERKELPLGVKFHVFNDPAGPKIGNGGSTIVVAEELEKLYPDSFKNLKVLILHAGGFSQRLPSGSLLGKIFMALPMGSPIYQMLELKLAMYIEYPQRMHAGMFVTSADTIELYVLDGDWTFMNSGFTAMAHPSPIEIGTTHGVFVLDNASMKTRIQFTKESRSVQNGVCRRFLHKPTKECMRSSEAVFIQNDQEYIYSDSAYFVDYSTVRLLLDWSKSHGKLDCEIDAYGDFLQALGPEGSSDYCKNVRNVTMAQENLVQTREKIFNALRNSKLNVLMLNKSKFYHIGTTMEYIHHFTEDLIYRYEMCCSNSSMVKDTSDSGRNFHQNQCVLHSYFEGENEIGDNSVVEYSWVGKGAKIGAKSIISNVFIEAGLVVPDCVFLHTVCVIGSSSDNERCYITVAFGVDDNLKMTCTNKQSTGELKYHQVKFDDALKLLGYEKSPWSDDCLLLNIWHAQIFPAFNDAKQSFQYGVEMMKCLSENRKMKQSDVNQTKLYSMACILKEKDIPGIFEMRSKIRAAILQN